MDLNLEGKLALVTGGSRGLGRAICAALAGEGAKVAVNSIRSDPAVLVRDLKKTGVQAIAVRADVSHPKQVRDMFNRIERGLGPVDILINNASVWPAALVNEMTLAQWNRTLAVNLTSAFLTSREAVRRWLAGKRKGRIVNITSQAAFHGSTTGHADYAAAKAGLTTFSISLAREVARHGIAVNSVAPGFMKTDMIASAWEKNSAKYLERIPLGRIADPEEVAATVLFLASERASYMTGATLHVNGGMEMR